MKSIRKIVLPALGFVGVAGFLACATFIKSLSAYAASSPTSSTVTASTTAPFFILQFGDKDVAVAALQELLIQRGYLLLSAPTGYFGALTEKAVMAAQKAQSLPQTGAVSVPVSDEKGLFAAAGSTFSQSSVGSTGTHIGFIQQFLIDHGYLQIKASTSYFGSMTKSAVMAFQKAKGLPQTGIVDQATFAAMNSDD